MSKTYSFLFIGNSYTYYNDMPNGIFEKIAQSAGYSVKVKAITKGAYKLSVFANPTDEYGALVEAALTGEEKYDFVILQEQSVLPASKTPRAFYNAVRNLSERIKASGAKPILYSTWGRKTGSHTLDTYGLTNESMTWRLAAAYYAIGDELDIPVVYAGLAFHDVYTNSNEIELYDPDMSHPSYEGSYLAAATLFAHIFDTDPAIIPISEEMTVSAATADILNDAAWRAVREPHDIPEEYQTTSLGIE